MSFKLTFTLLVVMCLTGTTFSLTDNSTNDDFSSEASIDDSWLSDLSNDDVTNNNDVADFEEETNSTLCSNLLSNDFSNGCQFWMQGVLLCVVGFGGVVGNSVSSPVLC